MVCRRASEANSRSPLKRHESILRRLRIPSEQHTNGLLESNMLRCEESSPTFYRQRSMLKGTIVLTTLRGYSGWENAVIAEHEQLS